MRKNIQSANIVHKNAFILDNFSGLAAGIPTLFVDVRYEAIDFGTAASCLSKTLG